MMQTEFNLNYEMEKKLPYACATVSGCTMPPSMSHGCLALIWKSKVARGLSISRILNKWPPIGVMQQSHAMKWWDLSFFSFRFPYVVVLMGILWTCTIYSTHSPYVRVWAHQLVRTPLGHFPYLVGILWKPLMLEPVRTSNRHGSAMQSITIIVLPLDVRVRTLVMG